MEMRFSSLIDHLGGTKNPLYLQLEEHRAKDTPVVDLVKGNVNEHGIVFPEDTLREILAEAVPAARVYRPDSFGQPVARDAVARYYGLARIRPENVLITPGTSVAYWHC